MTVEEFEKAILERADYLETGLETDLAKIANEVQAEMRQGKFKNRTGALRRSIRAKIKGQGLQTTMLRYGYYLSFGVQGYNRKKALGLTPEVAAAFGVKEGYKFGSNRVPGIAARNFYPDDIEEIIEELLLNVE
jgi:hypothetical protein